jgi:hypothetical protein
MYVEPNFTTKKALREAVESGAEVRVFSPGLFPAPTEGWTSVEGPHYPKSHSWYGQVRVCGGKVQEVK